MGRRLAALLFLLSTLAAAAALARRPHRRPVPPRVTISQEFHGDYREFAVAADHPFASEAGATILDAGGTAADAAAATMLALGVANPASSGLGGGGFLLYYRASDQSLHFLDFRERGPAASTPDMFVGTEPPMEGPANAASQLGGLASGVPGEAAGIVTMVERFGRLQLDRIVAPAVALAEGGVPITAQLAEGSRFFGAQMKEDPLMARWLGDDDVLVEGETLVQPELARTLRALGRRGRAGFYEGRVARQIVAANRRTGGIMTLQDLRDYTVVEREPLSAERFGMRWVTAPPPSAGGFTLLQSLGVLERIPARWRGAGATADYAHALAESWKGPFLDRQRYFGDPDHVELPLAAMGLSTRVDAIAAAFHPSLAMPSRDYDVPIEAAQNADQPEDHGTSHLCVIDAAGNIAAVTTTVNLVFGARYTAAGMVMNDEMDDFAREVGQANAFGLVGGAPNLPGPGKRPISSMSPTIVFRGDRPVLCAGAAGGSRIITATQQVAMNQLILGMGSADAMAAPRIHHQGGALRTEEFAPIDDARLEALLARGHAHRPIHHVAAVQAIAIA
ncbi:MAG: gamma-glutamyltransferase, partial [Myxococcota bacterium]